MADRPWTELYVSFCMKKYTPPSLEIMHAAVPLPSIDVCPKLESTYLKVSRAYIMCLHHVLTLALFCLNFLYPTRNVVHYFNHRH